MSLALEDAVYPHIWEGLVDSGYKRGKALSPDKIRGPDDEILHIRKYHTKGRASARSSLGRQSECTQRNVVLNGHQTTHCEVVEFMVHTSVKWAVVVRLKVKVGPSHLARNLTVNEEQQLLHLHRGVS